MSAFYNENDAYPAQWMRNLIDAGHIAQGVVDERSITELTPEDVNGFTQAHFFAGIGGWSHALRLAGWPDDVPVWTGSCPCQPFSVAGKRRGASDDRHLWPAWFRLIRECRPQCIFGEQVDSADGRAWLDSVCADLEGAGYAVGAAFLPAAGVGAPHGRPRIFFGAHALGERDGDAGRGTAGSETTGVQGAPRERERFRPDTRERGADGEFGADAERDTGDTRRTSRFGGSGDASAGSRAHAEPGRRGRAGNSSSLRCERGDGAGEQEPRTWKGRASVRGPGWLGADAARSLAAAGATRGFWGDCDWWIGRDGKARPIGPGLFPLAHGVPARVGRLRAYGNAIVPQVAAEFIRSMMECM